MAKFSKREVQQLVELAFAEYEEYKPFGADIFNGLDLAIYDLYPNEEDEPEGLYQHVAKILEKLTGEKL